MLLAKSCHDLDWIRYIMGEQCRFVSSFGSLKHFRKEEKPAGAAARCIDCGVEATCPYSCVKIYMRLLKNGYVGWPVAMLTPDVTEAGVMEALRTGPYGRCVYECDNDVVDHQVVNMLFDGGKTCSFTMTAFTELTDRRTCIFGTRGEIYGDGKTISHYDFLTEKKEVIDVAALDQTAAGGHGGGDHGLMEAFVGAVAENDRSKILSGPDETLESHMIVFAAEEARRNNTVVKVE